MQINEILDRYMMPAEWETHERTFVSWPVKDSMVWPENYDEFCGGYAEVIRAIAAFEPVTVIVNPEQLETASAMCGANVEFFEISHDDAWIRDNGPTFIWNANKKLKGINWRFNAWGEKYTPYDLDNALAPKILEMTRTFSWDAPIVLEGGSIHVDGEGTLLATEECLLNDNRNPELTRFEIEALVKAFVGVDKIIWLNKGLYGDETDGHVDNIACFARPGTIAMQVCFDPDDPNCEITMENLMRLRSTEDVNGRLPEIVEILQPPARYYRGKRLTLSYLNFYFVNGGLIVPVFGGDAEAYDYAAINKLQAIFPDRRIVAVDGMPLIKEGGNVHCITQQMPLGYL
jgi:agmatine deiminase